MKEIGLAPAAAGLSVLLMGAAPSAFMIELSGQNHPVFPCKDKNKNLKRSKCVDLNGYGGMKGRIFIEDYIIHCKTGGTRGPDKKVTDMTWNKMGRCSR